MNFPASASDLHVIYGSNEAGKSSLLRAIRDLLFGIHAQSPDGFLHDYKTLRIEGEIQNQAGLTLSFQRRKGNKDTILDAAGNSLSDNALVPFLGSVGQSYFSTMFGLGVGELREGAEQLLRGEGDIGTALFSASLGGTPIQSVLAALAEESEHLFKGRATANVSIRPTVHKYKDLQRQSREAIVNPEVWEKMEGEMAEAVTAKAKLEGDIAEIIRNLEWIARCEDAVPTVGRLSEEIRKIEQLPAMPDLSSDFVQRARSARAAAGDATKEVIRLTGQISKLEIQLAGCKTSPTVLAEAEALDRLHQGRGSYRERKNSLTDLRTQLAGIEAGLRASMQNLGMKGELDSLETIRLSSLNRLTCEEAANELQEALEERDDNTQKTDDLEKQIESLETQLDSFPETDLTALREALSVAAGATDANRTLSAAESEVKRLTRAVDLHLGQLIDAPKDFDATAILPVVAKSSIRRIREQMDGIKRNITSEEAKIQEGRKRIEAIQAELARIERRGELPSGLALREARDRRDHGWNLVLAEWKGEGSGEEFVPGVPLEEAFPQSIAHADGIADELLKQAEAVAQVEEKRFQIEKSEEQNRNSAQIVLGLQGEMKKCQDSWEVAWKPCGILPRSPDEMEEWRETWLGFKDILRDLRTAEESVRLKSNQVQHAKGHLATVLDQSEGKAFTLLYDESLRRVREGEVSAGRRIEITEQLRRLKSQLETLGQESARFVKAVEAATTKWNTQCEKVGLPEGTLPKSGLILLQERKEVLAKFDQWNELSTKSQKTMDAVSEYESAIKGKAVNFGNRGDTTEAQESALWNALAEARSIQTRHDQLAGQIEEAKNSLDEFQGSFAHANKGLEELVRLAKLETVDELEPLLANLELRDKAHGQIDAFRHTLSGLARGQSVDEFLVHIREENTEAIPARKAALISERQEKESALQIVRDTLSALRGQKERLETAGDAAADYRQQAESCAEKLKQDSSRFVRLRLAAHFLQAQIERFRKENQGPLLAKSGQVFNSITRGAFSGLGAEFNADDVPVLVGLRPDGTTVPVEGMSDGSRDQLYLALRLAALDRYLEQHEPMPLILDDLLITFDDARATAILPQLVTLAQRTQIFLFTHHDHLVELCRQTLNKASFHLHRL